MQLQCTELQEQGRLVTAYDTLDGTDRRARDHVSNLRLALHGRAKVLERVTH